MEVVIDYHDPVETVLLLQIPRADGAVVENARNPCFVRFRMVPGGSDEGKAVVDPSGQPGVYGLEKTPAAKQAASNDLADVTVSGSSLRAAFPAVSLTMLT